MVSNDEAIEDNLELSFVFPDCSNERNNKNIFSGDTKFFKLVVEHLQACRHSVLSLEGRLAF